MLPELASTLLGALVGLDPWRGWLYAAYYRVRLGGRGLAASSAVVAGSTILVTLMMAAPAIFSAQTHRYVSLLLLVYGVNTLIHGSLKLVYRRAHYYGSLKPRLGGLVAWCAVNAASEGYGLPVGCVALLGGLGEAYYFAAYGATFSAMVATTASFGATLVRRVGYNFDPLLFSAYVALGGWSTIYTVAHIAHATPWLYLGRVGGRTG